MPFRGVWRLLAFDGARWLLMIVADFDGVDDCRPFCVRY